MRSLRPLLALPLLLAGCVNTDAAVFVDPTITAPTAALGGSALGVTISGNFKLNLHLGARASGPSTVNLLSVSILDAGQKGTITSLEIGAGAMETFTVALDSDAGATIPFDLGSKTLPVAAKGTATGELCDPAGVVIGGVIQDSLQAVSTPFFSAAFHPTGCM